MPTAFASAFSSMTSAEVASPRVLTGNFAMSSASMRMMVGDLGEGFPAPPPGLPIDFLSMP
jgi:hypothetical protein